MMRNFLTPLSAFLALLVSAGMSVGDVVINEIHYDPEPNTEEVEFIELHNTGAASVNIGGWQFTEGISYTFPAGTMIPAGGYIVVCENPTALNAKYSVTGIGPWDGKLSNEGEDVTLKDAQGTTIDTVDYGVGFPWPLAARGTGASMELIHPSLDNSVGASWRASGYAPTCPSGTVSSYIPAESVGWSYFKGNASPVADGNNKTWWEDPDYVEGAGWLAGTGSIGYGESFITTQLSDMRNNYNTFFLRKTFTVADASTISGLLLRARFDDGVKIWINGEPVYDLLAPGDTTIPSTHTSNSTGNRNESNAHVYTSATLNSPIPSSYLVDGVNVIAIQVFNVTTGSSDCHFDCELKSLPVTSTGILLPSPTAQNNSHSAVSAPQARGLTVSPKNPTSNQAVNISLKVTDPQGVGAVKLMYQKVTPGSYIRRSDAAYEDTANWTEITMLDNGLGGDAAAGDTIFTCTIPANVQTHRGLVRYRIEVEDATGACVRLPYDDDTQPNFAYFTYDGVPSWTGKKTPTSSNVTYTGAELSRVPVYHLIALNSDVDQSQYNGGSNEQYFEATLVYDGVVYDHMKYRNKGSGSTYATGHNKWKINFNRGHRFQARDPYGKKYDVVWDKFSIQTSESPWWRNDAYPMSGMLFQEKLMTRVNNLANVHAPEMLHFHFRVIDGLAESKVSDQYDGDFWGIYTAQQHPDKSFFDHHDLPAGNLYKLNGSNANSASKWYQSSDQVDDASDLSSFINGYNNTNDAAWWAANFERSAYYSWNTLNLALNNSDLRREQNVIYWHNPETNRWHPCIWDVDLLFEDARHHNRDPYQWWEKFNRMFSHNQYYIEGQNRTRELQDLLLWNGQYDRLVDEQVLLLTGNSAGTTTNTLVDANQAMWNYHPRKTRKGNWYRIENNTYWSDFADMVTYMKAFPKPGGFGGDQLETKMTANADGLIPNKPTITYTGSAGHTTDGLSFQTSGFSDSTGTATDIQWRVGEIYDDSVTGYTAGDPWKYEITAVWESGELAWNGSVSSVTIPVSSVKVGKTYRARVRHKDSTGRWSRWSDAHEFQTSAPDISVYRNNLVVSEFHYNPADPSTPAELGASLDDSDFEFLELRNIGATPLVLNGLRVADAISFDFTGSDVTVLAPGQAVVVVKETAAFVARYGFGKPIAGEYSGKLSNGGELIRLSYGDGNTAANLIRSFTYDDVSPWPTEPDGGGQSAVLIDPWTLPDHNVGTNWRASHVEGGEPGAVDSWNYAAWRNNHGLGPAAAGQDADGDGVSDYMEYFHGTDPNAKNNELAFSTSVEDLVSEKYLVLTFTRNKNVEDLTHAAEENTDLLTTWGLGGIPVLIDATDNANSSKTTYRYRTSLPLEDYTADKVFLRLKVTNTP